MPKNATIDERITWHLAHAKNCACRPLGKKILEEILFSGSYKLNNNTINFSLDNKVTGLNGFSYYEPMIDYMDVAMNIDQLVLSNDKNERNLYGFKFIEDSLFIYNLKCMEKDSITGDCYVVDFGSILFKLKKVN